VERTVAGPAGELPAAEHRAVIGVGSNLDPEHHVALARRTLAEEQVLLGESRWVRTAALGPPDGAGRPTLRPDQPDYLNGAFLIATRLDLDALRRYLRELEARLGRQRGTDKFAARTIDLDVAVWDGVVVDPDVAVRDFLRVAVGELVPELVLPVTGSATAT
jgi:2-amino-4-hydroxy-6-hydroxymethyldihydropteridine diphosphokinase